MTKRKSISKKIRFEVFKRDGFTCAYCGRSSIVDKVKLAVDHIIPVKRGGSGDLDNLITSCKSCNAAKKDTLLSNKITESLVNRCKELNKTLSIKDKTKIKKHYESVTKLRFIKLVS